jgi:hypothetical protein
MQSLDVSSTSRQNGGSSSIPPKYLIESEAENFETPLTQPVSSLVADYAEKYLTNSES